MKTNYIWLLLISVIVFTACESDDDSLADPDFQDITTTVPTNGSADFSTFVAVGNSLTAGYSDNALFAKGQMVSFPNILANQFALVGGGAFTQPLMSDDVGGLVAGGVPIPGFGPRLIFDPVAQAPVTHPGTPTTDLLSPIPGPYNNMGVPGAKVGDLTTVGYVNPYFIRMASSTSTTVLQDALDMNPTFFSLWIGNNDVLGYATSGGDGSNPLTDVTSFATDYSQIVSQLVAASPQGILANIPSVTAAPFFTTVPYNPVPLDAATAAFLNSASAYGAYNAGIQAAFAYLVATTPMTQEQADAEIALRTITFEAGDSNAVVIMDESLTNLTAINPALVSMRQANADDLIILPASSFIGTTVGGDPQLINGVSVPLSDSWVLIPAEQEEIAMATEAFNQIISDAALTNNIPLFDANAFLTQVATTGVTSGSVTVTDDFVTGGAFSLDGVHPSPRGYAVAANEMIGIINATYGASVPPVNPANFTGVYLD